MLMWNHANMEMTVRRFGQSFPKQDGAVLCSGRSFPKQDGDSPCSGLAFPKQEPMSRGWFGLHS